MENDKDILETGLDPEAEEDTADTETDDEFEYDEDGNIIIPEIEFDEDEEDAEEETGEEVSDKEETEETEEETDEETEEEADEDTEETEEPPATDTNVGHTPDERDARIAQLEAELKEVNARGKEALRALGVKTDKLIDGLTELAAEAEGVSAEEYRKTKADEAELERARALLRSQEFERMAQTDLQAIHAAFPETREVTDIRKLPPDVLSRFGRFRDAGLSAKEAYAAANPDGIRTTVANAVKKKAGQDQKSHLRTVVPKGSKDDAVQMTRAELASWRDLFPGKSDKEIISLYKSTKQ